MLFRSIPLDKGEVYGWMTVSGDDGETDLHAVEAAFSRFPRLVKQAAASVGRGEAKLYRSPIEEVRTAEWSQDRVLLIGDAAHATAPVWAEGGALAIEDAVVLSGLLSHEDEWTKVVRRFEEVRRPRVAHVQTMTDKLSRSAKLPTRLRNFLMPFVGPKSYAATYGPLKTFEGATVRSGG